MGVDMAAPVEEKKPDRPPAKSAPLYPILNKYSEKTASVKELTTSKISTHKENTLSKEITSHTTVTTTNKNESEKLIHNETVIDGTPDGQVKKPPVPLKKSPTPASGVGGLFSGLKSKIIPSGDKEKSSPTVSSSSSSNSVEWDRTDGGGVSKQTVTQTTVNNSNTFDHIERNTILSDPRAGRVKAPRRRPPSQALRDDTPQQIGLSNGHEEKIEKTEKVEKTAAEKASDEIKPRTREWEKHKAPWMEELKLNQAKKTSFVADGKARSVSSDCGVASKVSTGSTDRILECGLEEKRSTHSMEMSKSTSSISSRISVLESFEETKVRHSLDSKKETVPSPKESDSQTKPPVLNSPTAAGRTILSMLEDIKKSPAPSPPLASARTSAEITNDKSPNSRTSITSEKSETITKVLESSGKSGVFERTSTLERLQKVDDKKEEKSSVEKSASGTLERERRSFSVKSDKGDGNDALIAQLNNRISNLEKLIEVQNSMFKSAIEDLNIKLKQESEKRQALQAEVEKLAHCVTQV